MDLPDNARLASLGGIVPTYLDSSIEYVVGNPSLIEPYNKGNSLITYNNYLADIHAGYITYVLNTEKLGIIRPFVKYVHYGNFIETDEAGVQLRKFSAGDMALGCSYGKPFLTHFRYGVDVNLIYSQLLYNSALGLSTDYYITYSKNISRWGTALIVENLGTPLLSYSQKNYEFMPLNVKLSSSFKLSHAPIRVHFMYDNINKWDLVAPNASNTSTDPITGETKKKTFTLDNFSRHLTFGSTFQPSKAFSINLAYDVRRGKEASSIYARKMAGFSFGFNIKLKKMAISYSLYGNGSGLNANYFTLSFLSLGSKK